MMPTAADRRAAAWVAGLFLAAVLLQRFAIPGLNTVALLVPVVLAWVTVALARGVVLVDSTRMIGWLAFALVTGCLMLVQYRVVSVSVISVKSWALMLVALLPFVARLAHHGTASYLLTLRHIANICTGLGLASILMVGIQFAGVPYEDWFGKIVPNSLQLTGFNNSYPVEFGSSIYKSNAFIGLEPSIISSLLGVGLLAAILVRAPWWKVLVFAVGLFMTVAGSGMIIVVIGVAVLLAIKESRHLVVRFLPVFALATVIASFTDLGQLVFGRVGEFQSADSSTSLRVFEPYRVLLPEWIQHVPGALLGYGPGSSQRIAESMPEETRIMVTTPIKIFFEYGLVGGAVLAGFVLLCYWGGPSRAFSISLVISIWLLQQGIVSLIITLPVLVTVTLWSPRIGAPIETLPRAPDCTGTEPRSSTALTAEVR
jgi:hypothetical protein